MWARICPPIDEPNFKLSLLVLDIFGMVVETLKVRLVTKQKFRNETNTSKCFYEIFLLQMYSLFVKGDGRLS
jgi:hypothetical protein